MKFNVSRPVTEPPIRDCNRGMGGPRVTGGLESRHARSNLSMPGIVPEMVDKDALLQKVAASTAALDAKQTELADLITQRDEAIVAAKAAGATWPELQQQAHLTPGGLRKVLQRKGLLDK